MRKRHCLSMGTLLLIERVTCATSTGLASPVAFPPGYTVILFGNQSIDSQLNALGCGPVLPVA